MDNTPTPRGRGKPPVNAHPAFPAVVALWFAALLGTGSLIMLLRIFSGYPEGVMFAVLLMNALTPLMNGWLKHWTMGETKQHRI